jgi:hypothetical protein
VEYTFLWDFENAAKYYFVTTTRFFYLSFYVSCISSHCIFLLKTNNSPWSVSYHFSLFFHIFSNPECTKHLSGKTPAAFNLLRFPQMLFRSTTTKLDHLFVFDVIALFAHGDRKHTSIKQHPPRN